VRFQVLTAANVKFRVFWDVAPCSHVEVDRCFKVRTTSMISAMTEAVNTSETSVNFNVTTLHYIPEDSKLCNKYVFNLSNKKTLQYKNEEVACRSNHQSYIPACIVFFGNTA
jgi:hypothetical protein